MREYRTAIDKNLSIFIAPYFINSFAVLFLGIFILLFFPPPLHAESELSLWNALKSGNHFVMLRHALAPGFSDPPEFIIGDCSTQRNLSLEGREQAAEIGRRFKAQGIAHAMVYSSQWCRCVDTAKLLELGKVEELIELNSFFQDMARGEDQTQQLKQWLATRKAKQPVVLVTHQVNITALTGVYPASGELVVVHQSADGQLAALGTITTDLQ